MRIKISQMHVEGLVLAASYISWSEEFAEQGGSAI